MLQAAFESHCSTRLRQASSADMDEYEDLVLDTLVGGLDALYHVGGNDASAIHSQRSNYLEWHGPEHVTPESFFATANERVRDGNRRTIESMFLLRHAADVSVCVSLRA